MYGDNRGPPREMHKVTCAECGKETEVPFKNRGPPREMHKVTCAECGKETEVPFKPDGTRPVYCRDCYQKHKPKRF